MWIKCKTRITPRELNYIDHKERVFRHYIMDQIYDEYEQTQLLECITRGCAWINRISFGDYIQKKSNGLSFYRINRCVNLFRNLNRRILLHVDQ